MEGDKKAPAGVFYLGKAYGKNTPATSPIPWPYENIDRDMICIDDVNHKSYNKIISVDYAKAKPAFSHETLLRSDHLYNKIVYVNHNSPATVAGAGSCIFLHVWRAPGSPTVGCTAMDQKNLENIISWLSPEFHSILVQLPKSEYKRLQNDWGLPTFPVHP